MLACAHTQLHACRYTHVYSAQARDNVDVCTCICMFICIYILYTNMTQGLSPPTPTPRPMYPPFAAWVLLRLTPGLSLSVVFALACHKQKLQSWLTRRMCMLYGNYTGLATQQPANLQKYACSYLSVVLSSSKRWLLHDTILDVAVFPVFRCRW